MHYERTENAGSRLGVSTAVHRAAAHRPSRWVSEVALTLWATLVAPSASAGSLDRFEAAHTDDDRSTSNSSSSSSTSSSSSSSTSLFDDDDDTPMASVTDDSDGTALAYLGCALPPFTFACFHPSFRISDRPYDPKGLYIRPAGEEGAAVWSDVRYAARDASRQRWFELVGSGYAALNEDLVFSHTLDLQLWLGMFTAKAGWEHMYELPEAEPASRDDVEVDHLNLYRFHLGTNVLGPAVDGAELYLLAGALLLHGDELTPAFDAGLELRAYPADPMTIYASTHLSVFEVGPVLLDATVQLGVTFGPVEVRAGPRVLYQGEAQGFWGPATAVAFRF